MGDSKKQFPVQFSLTALLTLFVAVWSAMALLGAELGLYVSLIFVVGLLSCGRLTCLEWVVVVFILCALVALLLPPVEMGVTSARSAQCRANLMNVAQAIRAYHIDHGQYPPACTRDAQGRPMHSWRVLILPQLGYDNLYAAYRFDEPWDGPNNSKLLASIPKEYVCPAMLGRRGGGGVTTCVAVTGPETMWPSDRPMHEGNISDGPDQTVMIGEASPDLAIGWLEPRDLPFEKAALGIHTMDWSGNNKVDRLVAAHPWPYDKSSKKRASHVMTADGHVYELPEDLRPSDLRALLTAAGGESIDIQKDIIQPPKPPSITGKIISAVLLALSLIVLTVSVTRRRRALAAESEEIAANPSGTA